MTFSKNCKRIIMVAALAAALHAGAATDAGAAAVQRGAAKAAAVEKAPDFVLTDLNGRKFRLGDFKGKQPVLIIFSTTWCPSCREEIPRFKALHEKYAKRGLEIVNIDIEETKDKVARFAAKYGLPYRVLRDEDGAVSGIYGIRGVPSLVLVDKNGNILCHQCRNIDTMLESIMPKR